VRDGNPIGVTTGAERAFARAAKDRRVHVFMGAAAAGAAALAAKAGIDRLSNGGSGPSRSYRLKRGEGTKKGVRRIAAGRAEHPLEQLDSARKGSLATGVHEARKDLKKLRSALRLSRDGLGEKTYRRENERYRDAARRLSGARDAEVKLKTLSSLEERFGKELPKGTVDDLRDALERERPEEADEKHLDQLLSASAEIAAGHKEIREWAIKRGGWDLIEPGLRRSYRRGRKSMGRARDDPSDKNLHEWRKRVKDLWYHLRIVRGAAPGVLGEAANRAHELSDLLGDHHDLAVLADEVRSRTDAFDIGKQRAALLSAIRWRQSELAADAFEIGDPLYAEKSKAFSRRIEAYWRTWRDRAE
jgi:CHAD domain-containing protein